MAGGVMVSPIAVPGAGAAEARRPPARSPLAGPFRWLWLAGGVSSIGDGLAAVALPLLAVTLTRDPRLVAGVVVAQRLPWLLLGLPAGSLVDRWDHRRVLAISEFSRTAILLTLGLAVAG